MWIGECLLVNLALSIFAVLCRAVTSLADPAARAKVTWLNPKHCCFEVHLAHVGAADTAETAQSKHHEYVTQLLEECNVLTASYGAGAICSTVPEVLWWAAISQLKALAPYSSALTRQLLFCACSATKNKQVGQYLACMLPEQGVALSCLLLDSG